MECGTGLRTYRDGTAARRRRPHVAEGIYALAPGAPGYSVVSYRVPAVCDAKRVPSQARAAARWQECAPPDRRPWGGAADALYAKEGASLRWSLLRRWISGTDGGAKPLHELFASVLRRGSWGDLCATAFGAQSVGLLAEAHLVTCPDRAAPVYPAHPAVWVVSMPAEELPALLHGPAGRLLACRSPYARLRAGRVELAAQVVFSPGELGRVFGLRARGLHAQFVKATQGVDFSDAAAVADWMGTWDASMPHVPPPGTVQAIVDMAPTLGQYTQLLKSPREWAPCLVQARTEAGVKFDRRVAWAAALAGVAVAGGLSAERMRKVIEPVVRRAVPPGAMHAARVADVLRAMGWFIAKQRNTPAARARQHTCARDGDRLCCPRKANPCPVVSIVDACAVPASGGPAKRICYDDGADAR